MSDVGIKTRADMGYTLSSGEILVLLRWVVLQEESSHWEQLLLSLLDELVSHRDDFAEKERTYALRIVERVNIQLGVSDICLL
jgi:hypothetical protein